MCPSTPAGMQQRVNGPGRSRHIDEAGCLAHDVAGTLPACPGLPERKGLRGMARLCGCLLLALGPGLCPDKSQSRAN